MTGLKKRQEHGPGSCGVYVDLVMAFGTASLGALWEVLRKSGMPGHFLGMPMRLHADAVIVVEIGKEDTALGSSTGVRQGACEGPPLFSSSFRRLLGRWSSPWPSPPSTSAPMG